MTCKYNYKSISLRNKTMEKLKDLSVSLVSGKQLSNAKTVEYLIDHSLTREETKNGVKDYDKETTKAFI